MKRALIAIVCSVIVLSAIALIFSSGSYTWVGQTFLYPPTLKPLDSQRAEFEIVVESHGAIGKAYSARTKKKVFLWFNKQNLTKTKTQYTVNAADLNFDVTWNAPGDFILHFYDLPDGISSYDQQAKSLRKEILTKHFHYEAGSDSFRE
jgi:hypothetical protein